MPLQNFIGALNATFFYCVPHNFGSKINNKNKDRQKTDSKTAQNCYYSEQLDENIIICNQLSQTRTDRYICSYPPLKNSVCSLQLILTNHSIFFM